MRALLLAPALLTLTLSSCGRDALFRDCKKETAYRFDAMGVDLVKMRQTEGGEVSKGTLVMKDGQDLKEYTYLCTRAPDGGIDSAITPVN